MASRALVLTFLLFALSQVDTLRHSRSLQSECEESLGEAYRIYNNYVAELPCVHVHAMYTNAKRAAMTRSFVRAEQVRPLAFAFVFVVPAFGNDQFYTCTVKGRLSEEELFTVLAESVKNTTLYDAFDALLGPEDPDNFKEAMMQLTKIINHRRQQNLLSRSFRALEEPVKRCVKRFSPSVNDRLVDYILKIVPRFLP